MRRQCDPDSGRRIAAPWPELGGERLLRKRAEACRDLECCWKLLLRRKISQLSGHPANGRDFPPFQDRLQTGATISMGVYTNTN